MKKSVMLAEAVSTRPPLNGVYFATRLGAPNSTQRNLTLVLTGDGVAVLVIEFIGKGTIIERGSWAARDSHVEIFWTELDGEVIALRMNFELRGSDLVYVGPDPNALGSVPVRLGRACNGHSTPAPIVEPTVVGSVQAAPA